MKCMQYTIKDPIYWKYQNYLISFVQEKIKFIQKVEQFIGPELDTCGPFEPEQTQELPAEIADILLEKGSAIEVK